MTAPAIKSRPVYTGLQISPHGGRFLFALEAEGALALIERAPNVGFEFLSRAQILYLGRGSQRHVGPLQELAAAHFAQLPDLESLLQGLRQALATATMGTRVYVAGTEGFIGRVLQVAMQFDIDATSVFTEHRGSLARRVQCVHCKAITEEVMHTPFICSGCGLRLFVRDHYSRRIAAFQGVNIDAEAPALVQAPEELYP